MGMVIPMNKSMNFFKFYLKSEIVKSVLTSFLFFAIPASVIIIAGVETIVLMIPSIFTIILIMFVLLLGLSYFSTKVLVDTFKNYKVYDDFDYKLLFWLFYIIMAVVITIAGLVVLLLFR